jgi:hypothetical protein
LNKAFDVGMREDTITGIFKTLINYSPPPTQMSIINTLLSPFDEKVNPEDSAIKFDYGLRNSKIYFNSVPDGVVVFDNSIPDFWIKISKNEVDLILIVIEVKIVWSQTNSVHLI